MKTLHQISVGVMVLILTLLAVYVGSYFAIGERWIDKTGNPHVVFETKRRAMFFEPAAKTETWIRGYDVFLNWRQPSY